MLTPSGKRRGKGRGYLEVEGLQVKDQSAEDGVSAGFRLSRGGQGVFGGLEDWRVPGHGGQVDPLLQSQGEEVFCTEDRQKIAFGVWDHVHGPDVKVGPHVLEAVHGLLVFSVENRE